VNLQNARYNNKDNWTVIIYYGMTCFVKWKVWTLAIVWTLTILFCKSPDRL